MKRTISILSAMLLVGGFAFHTGFARSAEGAGASEPMSASAQDAGVRTEDSQSPDHGMLQAGASATDASASAADASSAESDEDSEQASSPQGSQDSDSADADEDSDSDD
jgi:hypothetical protein